jgi:hypothetical protein
MCPNFGAIKSMLGTACIVTEQESLLCLRADRAMKLGATASNLVVVDAEIGEAQQYFEGLFKNDNLGWFEDIDQVCEKGNLEPPGLDVENAYYYDVCKVQINKKFVKLFVNY